MMSKKMGLGLVAALGLGLVFALGFAMFSFRGSLAAALAQATGTPAASSGTGNVNYREAFIKNLATRLKVTEDALKSAISSALGDTADQAVKDGNLTQQQADQMKQRFQQGDLPFNMPFGGKFGRGQGGKGFGEMGDLGLAAFAKAMNLDEQALMTELTGGKSINDAIKAHNLDAATVKQAVLDAAKAQLAQAVTANKMTQAQADQAYQRLSSQIDQAMARTWQAGPDDFHGWGGKMMGPAGGMGMGMLRIGINEFATAMKMDPSALMQQLQAGKSINDVIKAQNLDAATVKQAVLDAVKTRMDQAVTSNRLTQDQENQALQNLSSQLDQLMSQPWNTGKHWPGQPGQQSQPTQPAATPVPGTL